jgi:hypothetical protein
MVKYIMVPFAQKNEVQNLGARWNVDIKQWYIPDNLDKARSDELLSKFDYVYLNVQYKDKDHVKALGAAWHAQVKKWYTLKSNPKYDKLEDYIENEEKIEDLDNEDYDDMLPYIALSEVNHLPDEMDFKDYTRLNEYIRTRSDGCCQLCTKDKLNMNALYTCEVYEYIFEEKVKKLTRLFCVCKDCRNLYRYGIKNNNTFQLKHVSNMNDDDAIVYMSNMREKKIEVDQIKWELNLDLITSNGLQLK